MTDDCKIERVALLPCPFCGGEERLITSNEFGGFCISCESCNAVGPPSEYDPEEMREAWNTRASTPSPTVQEAAKVLAEWFDANVVRDYISLPHETRTLHSETLLKWLNATAAAPDNGD
jgi:Lar family restriction alleviation protein